MRDVKTVPPLRWAWISALALLMLTGVILGLNDLAFASRLVDGAAVAVFTHHMVGRAMAKRMSGRWMITRRRAWLRAARGWSAAAGLGALGAFLEGIPLSHPFEQQAIGIAGAFTTSLALLLWWGRRAHRLATDSAAYAYADRAGVAYGDPGIAMEVPVADWVRLRAAGIDPEVAGARMAQGGTADQILTGHAADIPPSLAGGAL